MRAEFVIEALGDILKPKSKEEFREYAEKEDLKRENY